MQEIQLMTILQEEESDMNNLSGRKKILARYGYGKTSTNLPLAMNFDVGEGLLAHRARRVENEL